MKNSQNYVGQYFEIPAGLQITTQAGKRTQTRDSIVRVKRATTDKKGRTVIHWKSNGSMVSTAL